MAWVFLLVAGLLEVVWASVLPKSEGFTRLGPTAIFLVAMVGSMLLLAKAMQTIPLGTAYPVWVGVGTLGAAIVGLILYDEPAGALRIFFLATLVASIIGLRVTGE